MNINYMNAVTVDLIEKNDYIPIKDNSGQYVLNDNIRILQKATTQTFNLICLINVDIHTDFELQNALENNLNWMNGVNITGISDELVFTEILIFSNRPDTSKFEIMEEHKKIILASKSIFEIIIVELEQKNLFDYFDTEASSNELKIILSNSLFKELNTYTSMPDVEELINRQPQEPQLEMVTNKVPATYVLIGINIAVWLLGQLFLFIFKEDYLTTFGVKDNTAILRGEYWRLITPIFLHADIMHISANSFSLLIFGQIVERMFGTKKFLIIYFIAGFLGNIASFVFSNTLSLGASGAIMGIGGSFVYIWLKNRETFSGNSRQYLTFVFLVFFNLFYGFTRPGIDNFAHFGGFIGGFLSAGTLYKNPKENRLLFAFTLIVIIIIGIIFGFK